MFCSNCGRKCEDGARFCPDCGKALGGGVLKSNINVIPTNGITFSVEKGKRIVFLGLIILSTILSALGMFLPIISAELDLYFDIYERSCNIFELFDLIEIIENLGGSIGVFKFIFIVCIGLSIIICIAALKFLYDVFNGVKGEELLDSVNLVSGFCVVRFVIILAVVLLVNHATSEELYGAKFLSVTGWGWLIVICSCVNMALFSRMYLESVETNVEDSMSKVCPKCGTQFTIGEICPKCGMSVK